MTTEVEQAAPAADPIDKLATVPMGKPLQNLSQAVLLSRGLIDAGLIPESLKKNPKDILVILIYGAELGLLPMQSVQGIYVVKGRPMLSAQLWAAKIAEAKHRLAILESTDTRAKVRITRGDNGQVFEETFTLEDAENAGLTGIKEGKAYARGRSGDKLPWEQWTRAMLRYRALVFCARTACPEVCFGAGIHGEEYDDQDAPDMRPGNFVVEQVAEAQDIDREDTYAELKALEAAARAENLTAEVIDAEDAEFEAVLR